VSEAEAPAPAPDAPTAPAEARRAPLWPWLLGLAVLGLLLQARAAAPAVWQGPSDAAKYLALARALPDYALYDDHPYLIHPPAFPAAIRGVAELTSAALPTAGVLLASLATVGLALLAFALAHRLLGGSVAGGLTAALLLLCSRAAAFLGQGVWREPFQTLLTFGLLLLALTERPAAGRRRRGLEVGGATLLGGLMGLTWDPFVLLAPLLLAGAWLLGRRTLLVAALALAIAWSGWATWRYATLTGEPTYPAGIDGLPEDTRAAGPKAFFNPNLLPRTARHNAYFWGPAATPLRPFAAAAPWLAAPEGVHFTLTRPAPGLHLASVALAAVAIAGAFLLARAPPAGRGRELLLVVAVAGLLGGPGLVGRTARYGYALLPLIGLLAGACVAAATRRDPARERRAAVAVAVVGLLLGALWVATRPAWTWARPQRFEGRVVARVLADLDPAPSAVAAPVGLTPDLCWQLPGRRVVTLPLDPDHGLDALLAAREVEVVVLPHEVPAWRRPGADDAWHAYAHGLATRSALAAAAARGELRHLGVAVEAERTDAVRVRAFDVLWRGPGGPDPFGCRVEPAGLPALAAALEAGAVSSETRRLLRAHPGALAAWRDDPDRGPAARRALAALGR